MDDHLLCDKCKSNGRDEGSECCKNCDDLQKKHEILLTDLCDALTAGNLRRVKLLVEQGNVQSWDLEKERVIGRGRTTALGIAAAKASLI